MPDCRDSTVRYVAGPVLSAPCNFLSTNIAGKCKKDIKPQGSDSFIYYTYVTEIRFGLNTEMNVQALQNVRLTRHQQQGSKQTQSGLAI